MDVNILRQLLASGINPDDLGGMGENDLAKLLMPMPTAPDVPPMAMNTMRVESGPDQGKVTNLNFSGAQGSPQAPSGFPQGMAPQGPSRQMQVMGAGNGTSVNLSPEQAPGRVNIDMSRPQVDTMGGKAYYSKDEPGVAYVLNPDGSPKAKILLGYDDAGSRARTRDNLEQQKTQTDILHTQEQTRASQVANPDYSGTGTVEAMNSGVTGTAFLKTLDPVIAKEVQTIGDGDVAFNPRSPRQMQILGLVKAYNPAFSGTEYVAKQSTTKDFATGGKSGQVVQAINQALHHAATVSDAIDALGNSNVMPGVVNAPLNWAEKNLLGDTRQGNFSTAAMALAEELKKIYAGGGGGSLKELESWQQSFDPNAGHDQQKSYLSQGMKLLQGAIESRQESYQRGMGPAADFGKLFSPQALEALQKLEGQGMLTVPGLSRGQGAPTDSPSAPVQLSGSQRSRHIFDARKALDQGAPRDKVVARLQQLGISDAGI